MWVGLVFAFLGVFGSALPAHLGMRILANREHLDRQLPFVSGTETSSIRTIAAVTQCSARAVASYPAAPAPIACASMIVSPSGAVP
jgi:hypothetical protein